MKPWFSRRSRTSGAFSARLRSMFSCLTTAFGVAAGAMMPNQLRNAYPGAFHGDDVLDESCGRSLVLAQMSLLQAMHVYGLDDLAKQATKSSGDFL